MTWNFSETAVNFIEELSAERAKPAVVELVVTSPGEPSATLTVRFIDSVDESHKVTQLTNELIVATDKINSEALDQLDVNFVTDATGSGELEIKAPKLYGDTSKWTLVEKLNQYMASEIAPYLQSHNGNAKVIEINSKQEAIIEFSGGCQGCSMAQVTLKSGIEKKIMDKFPQITAVVDFTDHQKGTNPYYSDIDD